jgi:hypothetical protein
MPKKYEDEIRDILRDMDKRFPSENGARRRQTAPRLSMPRWDALRNINPQKLMGGALILLLFGWIMRGPWSWGFPEMSRLAGYISMVGIVLVVVSLILLVRAGSFGSAGPSVYREKRWRGQVINMPRRGGLLWTWRRNLGRWLAGLRGNSGRGRPKGRDTVQW